ncbi:MAG: hypothetical protein K6B15_09945 [Parasporobacterium sp.]|nr:hypothetical protein [Parasporobacterium sp.]
MNKKNRLWLICLVIYAVICAIIMALNVIMTRGHYIYYSVSNDKVIAFVGVIAVCVAIPCIIVVLLIRAYLKKENTTKKTMYSAIIVSIASIVLSVFVTTIWYFSEPIQSYTNNVKNYGVVDYDVEQFIEKAVPVFYFPESLDELGSETVSYKYQYKSPFNKHRYIMMDLKVEFPSSKEYNEALKLIQDSGEFTKIGDAYIRKMSIDDEKSYVLTGPLTLEYYYEYGSL